MSRCGDCRLWEPRPGQGVGLCTLPEDTLPPLTIVRPEGCGHTTQLLTTPDFYCARFVAPTRPLPAGRV